MFAEPLSTLLSLLSFELIVKVVSGGASYAGTRAVFLAGLLLGCAAATHITAVLLVPFYGLYLFAGLSRRTGPEGRTSRALLTEFLLVGVSVVVLLLLYYNYARFGNPAETGRTIDYVALRRFGYGYFVAPWQGLLGLLVSPGKSILLYCPAVLLGAFAWNHLRRKDGLLAWTIAGIVLLRWVFIASRFDWPGGFSLGPRYLVPVIPFAVIPAAFWLSDQISLRRTSNVLLFLLATFVAVLQQFYFALGEVFSFYYLIVIFAGREAGKLFAGWTIYYAPQYSPLLHMLEGRRGPFLLKLIDVPNHTLFLAAVLILTGLTCLAAWKLQRHFAREALA